MTYAPAFVDVGPCWVCGGTALSRWHEAVLELSAFGEQDRELAGYTGARVWLRRCGACGFAQPERLPALAGYFDRMYDQRWSAAWIAREFEAGYKDVIFSRVLASLAARLPAPRRTLLDIGAHVGRFLHLARHAGWRAEGVELNPSTAAFARARTGVPVHHVNADDIPSLGRRFDAVTVIDVLEHIPRPVELLTGLRSVMLPGGWIAVKVPNGPAQRLKESVRERVVPRYRATLADNLVHVNHFSPRSLRTALARAGFEAVDLEVGAPELPPGTAWRDVAARTLRRAIFHGARIVPAGVHTPLALNLQAYARSPAP
jgi:2-polyprenyl-3-methyl-5-hydroxy-6-metoxy-1,4-benzoquinol methylase